MSREFSDKLQTCFNKSACRFKNNQDGYTKRPVCRLKRNRDGYIFILMCCFIPVILLGAKLVLDTQTEHVSKKHSVYKKCAREAVLEVAKKWNPALTYYQQRFALLKVADDVYNKSPAYSTAGMKYSAIPGLEIPTKIKTTRGGKYDPLKVATDDYEIVSLSPSSKTVKYTTDTSGYFRAYALNSANCDHGSRSLEQMYHAIYCMEKSSYFVLEDTIIYCTIVRSGNSACRTYGTLRTLNKTPFTTYASLGGLANVSGTFSKRSNENDTTVRISVENDKIKVQTDDDIAYAQPAACNVDIVLGIPVNGAACNVNNRDAHTTTTGSSYYQTSTAFQDTAKTTPIYQIAQAFRSFVKNNFYYTKGSHVGLVPYSGNLSIPQDRITTWAEVYPSFITSYFSSDQNAYPAFFRPCYSYGIGNTTSLSSGIYSNIWKGLGGCDYSGLNIMARKGKYWTETASGLNTIFACDLLSTASPTSTATSTYSYKFGYPSLRYVPYRNSINYLNFCFGYYRDGTTTAGSYESQYLVANPYHAAEITPDLLKITDLLNCFYPFSHSGCSESNFIFLPVTWANNLFQSWTKSTQFSAQNTTASTPSAISASNSGRLSCPSKSTSGRKKAVIIVVNKPDWFEPNEITYLGYDNDYSEVPMVESDCIRFDIQQTSSQKFADGTSKNAVTTPTSDNRLYGAKKILSYYSSDNSDKFSWNSADSNYQCSDSSSKITGVLNFPKKYLLKVVVEPADNTSWTKYTTSSLYSMAHNWWYNIGSVGVGPVNGQQKLLVAHIAGAIAISSDGINWEKITDFAINNWYGGFVYGNGIWTSVAIMRDNNNIAISNDGRNWNLSKNTSLTRWGPMVFFNGKFIFQSTDESSYPWRLFSSTDGLNWSLLPSTPITDTHICMIYNKDDQLIVGSGNDTFYRSTNNGTSWTLITSNLSSIGSGRWMSGNCKVNSRHYAVCDATGSNAKVARSFDFQNWSLVTVLNCSSQHRNITYFNGKLYVLGLSGDCCHVGTFLPANISFYTTNGVYSINSRKEFYIEPSQISEGSDGNYTVEFDMENIRLISAEITNRPYKKVTPRCRKEGTTRSSGPATGYLCSNIKKTMIWRVEPWSTSGVGTVTYTNTAGVSKTITIGYPNNNLPESDIAIDPSEFQFVKQSDGTYKVTVNINYIEDDPGYVSSQLHFADNLPSYCIVFDDIRIPNESRAVNFLKNSSDNFVYSVCGQETTGSNNYILAGSAPNASKGAMEIRWNTTKACWEFYPNTACSHSDHFWPMNYAGDMYMLADATEIQPSVDPFYYIWTDPNGTGSATYRSEYFGTNLYRSFWNFQNYKRAPSSSSAFAYTFETYNTVLPLIYGGFTLPINAALFFGASGTTLHKYAFQSTLNSTNSTWTWNGNDATTGVKNVTVEALKKLYSDWSSNIRIYVILYRKQTQYTHPVTKVATNFSYKYLTDLAANTTTSGTASATTSKPIYRCIDVSSESSLNSTLSSIAAELKNWAGYVGAKVVE